MPSLARTPCGVGPGRGVHVIAQYGGRAQGRCTISTMTYTRVCSRHMHRAREGWGEAAAAHGSVSAPLRAALLQELGSDRGPIEYLPSSLHQHCVLCPAAVREPLDGVGPGPAIGASMRRHCVLRSCALFSHARQVRAVQGMLHLLAGGLTLFPCNLIAHLCHTMPRSIPDK